MGVSERADELAMERCERGVLVVFAACHAATRQPIGSSVASFPLGKEELACLLLEAGANDRGGLPGSC